MNNEITYFRLDSAYSNKSPKNCALTANEMDNNFYALEGRDVKEVEVVNDQIVITLLNGDRICSKDGLKEYAKNLNISFDKTTGELTVEHNGEVQKFNGFITSENYSDPVTKVKTNHTIKGDGTSTSPLSVAKNYQTGQYKPVLEIIQPEKTDDPCCTFKPKSLPIDAKAGDRYITKEEYNDYGFLYPFDGVRKLRCDLKDSGYDWDIPTKEDWDNMLNAIEPLPEWQNHDDVITHRYLGKRAGKFLKSTDKWRLEDIYCDSYEDETDNCGNKNNSCNCHCESNQNMCYDSTTSINTICELPNDKYPNRGIDKYGFGILPAGYADEDKKYQYYRERAYMWTRTNSGYGAYVKRFDYDFSKVYQETIDLDCYASIRLVKKWDGSNFNDTEEIFGESYPTLMVPSKDGGFTIWTAINIQLNNKCYKNFRLPVDGLDCITRYYINEWNGERWIKNQLFEGDSVVVIKAPENKSNIEYRIIDGVLVDTTKAIYNEVMNNVDKEFDKIKIDIDTINGTLIKHGERLDNLEDELNAEIKNREENDLKLFKFIQDEAEIRESEDTRIEENLNSEIRERKYEDNRIEERLDSEIERSTEFDTEIEIKLNNEIEERKSEDVTLLKLIQNEAETREAEDTRIEENLNAEIEERKYEDARIEERLDAEIERSTEFDTEIEEKVNTEIEERKSEDEKLKKLIEEETEKRKSEDARIEEKLDTEIEERKSEDIRIEKQIPNVGLYDEKSGVLTLSRDDETKIEVPFSFNFGKF